MLLLLFYASFFMLGASGVSDDRFLRVVSRGVFGR